MFKITFDGCIIVTAAQNPIIKWLR